VSNDRSDPGRQPSTANRNEHGVDIVDLLEKLDCDRTLN
jgi:hypothetical protein